MKGEPIGAESETPTLPGRLSSEAELDDLLTRPRPDLVRAIREYASPLLILGAGGKMGPTLAVLARRAADAAGHRLEILAASRFSDPRARDWLEARGVRTLRCDLLEDEAVRRLPDSANVLHLVGLKFGTSRNPAATWAANTLVPDRVCRRFPEARIVALSSGNVYPPSEVTRGGSGESDDLTPLGEYANAAVARERIFEFHAQNRGTRMALLRLFYAIDLRYGVLVDLARKIHRGEAIDLATSHLNCLWQGDANDAVLRALPLAEAPPSVWNLCLPPFAVRPVAEALGQRLGRPPVFSGQALPTALLGNPERLWARLGPPAVDLERLLDWTAHWVQSGGRDLGRPTHFETRDGRY